MTQHELASRDTEMAVVGSVLISPDVIAEVCDWLPAAAFADSQARFVYGLMLKMWERREPADMPSLCAEIVMCGIKSPLAVDEFLAACLGVEKRWSFVGYYAEKVLKLAELRAIEAGASGIIKSLHDGVDGFDLDLAFRDIQESVAPFRKLDASEDFAVQVEASQQEAIALWEGSYFPKVVPTRIRRLDRMLNGGFMPNDVVVLAGRTAMGKALALDTPIPTPDGWSTMENLQVGDEVYDENGRVCRVTFATGVMLDRPCYSVRFNDGSAIVADEEHQWRTTTRAQRRGLAKQRESITTGEIRETVKVGGQDWANHAVPVAGPLEGHDDPLPIPPYTLGAWLGDGNTGGGAITGIDSEILEHIRSDGFEVRPRKDPIIFGILGLSSLLRKSGILGCKFIPMEYLRASEASRRLLLAGLLDTDGHVDRNGNVEFVSKRSLLAVQVRELLISLGYRVSFKPKEAWIGPKGSGKYCGTVFRVRFAPHNQVFGITRKQIGLMPVRPRKRSRVRYITAVDPVDSVPVRCIQVDSPTHMFLAGSSMIPTHNTSAMLHVAKQHKSLVCSLEMPSSQLIDRMIATEAGVSFGTRLSPTGDVAHQDRWLAASEKVKTWPLKVTSKLRTTSKIEAEVDRMQREGAIDCVFIDQVSWLQDPMGPRANEYERISKLSRRCAEMGKRVGVPIVLLAQLGRQVEDRQGCIPQMSDLKESGRLEEDATIVLLLYRRSYYASRKMGGLSVEPVNDYIDGHPEWERLSIMVEKNRNGLTGKVDAGWEGSAMAIRDVVTPDQLWRAS